MMLRTNGEALSFSQRSGLLAKMSLLFQHSMSLARFSTVAALLSCALPSRATPTYSYGISENVPCITGCGRFLALDGTIDVDALGTLSESNFVRWDLLIQFPGGAPVFLNESNSTFRVFGSTQITANEIDLAVVAQGDSGIFVFGSRLGEWIFSGPPNNGHTVVYGDDEALGFEPVNVPATLTLDRHYSGPGPVPVPEPATGVLMLLSSVLIFPALKRIGRATARWYLLTWPQCCWNSWTKCRR